MQQSNFDDLYIPTTKSAMAYQKALYSFFGMGSRFSAITPHNYDVNDFISIYSVLGRMNFLTGE